MSRLVEFVRAEGDFLAWSALVYLLRRVAQLGNAETPKDQDLARAALAVDRQGARLFAATLKELRERADLLRLFEEAVPADSPSFAALAAGFDDEVFENSLDGTIPALLAIAAAYGQSTRGKGPGRGAPANDIPIRLPGGGADPGAGAVDGGAEVNAPPAVDMVEEVGDDPRDTPPWQIFGEQLDGTKFAISILFWKCNSPTTPSLFVDQLAWACSGYQRFKDFPLLLQIDFVSREHDRIDTDYVLSRLSSVRSPAQETTYITQAEDRISPRAYAKSLGQQGITIQDYVSGTFHLDKFEQCYVTITLIESDLATEQLIADFFDLLTALAGTGVVSASAAAPAIAIAGGLTAGGPAQQVPDAFRRLGEVFRKLIRGKSNQIGERSFTIRAEDIRAAFDSETPIDPGEGLGFVYVNGPQATYSGKGAEYVLQIRYERYGS